MRSLKALFPLFLAPSTPAFLNFGQHREDAPATASIVDLGLGPGGVQPLASTHQQSSNLFSSILDVTAASIPTDRKSFTPKTTTTTQPQTSSTTLTSASVPASTSPVPQLDLCWSSNSCSAVIQDLEGCLDKVKPIQINDPNKVKESSERFQTCLCTEAYKNIITHNTTSTIMECYACIRQAGIDIDAANLPPAHFRQKSSDFCNTDQPSMFDLLLALLNFTQYGRKPDDRGFVRPDVSTITNFFTPTPGMNKPTTTAASAATDKQQWWESTLSQGGLIPTQYLAQLPPNWPYTAYAILRTAGPTTSWPLTHPNTTLKTVAWVYHSILWNPRPVYTPKSATSPSQTLYDPELANWTHAFLYETVTMTRESLTTETETTMTMRSTARVTSMARVTGNLFVPTVTQSGLLALETNSDVEKIQSSTGVGVKEVTSINSVTKEMAMTTQVPLDGSKIPVGHEEATRDWSRLLDELKSLEGRLSVSMGPRTRAETVNGDIVSTG